MEPLNPLRRQQQPAREAGAPPLFPPWGGTGVRLAKPEGWLKFETGWLSVDQALGNLETAISLFQTVSEAVVTIGNLTGDAIGALHGSWNRGNRSQPPPRELGRLLGRRLEQIDEIARATRFHGRGLINGQSGVEGVGEGVDFVRGGPRTQNSPPEGYPVRLLGPPSRASLIGGVPIHEDWVRAEREIFLAEGERFFRFSPEGLGTVAEFLVALQEQVRNAGLDLEVGLTRQRRLILRHNQYGSHLKFKGCSRVTPLISNRPGKIEWSRKGKDIQGTLGGEPAFGLGRMLVGFLDNPRTSELAVMWRETDPASRIARCHVVQNGIAFQDTAGAPQELRRISLPSFHPARMGRWVEGRSGFRSLADTRADSWQQVADALQMLFAVSCEVDEWRERVQNWTQQAQNMALEYLRKEVPPSAPPLSVAAEREVLAQMAKAMRGMIRRGSLGAG